MQVSDVHETATVQLNVKWLPVARAGVYMQKSVQCDDLPRDSLPVRHAAASCTQR